MATNEKTDTPMTVRILAQYDLAEACDSSRPDHRYGLGCISIRSDANRAEATDGTIFASVPVKIEGKQRDCLIPSQLLTRAKRYNRGPILISVSQEVAKTKIGRLGAIEVELSDRAWPDMSQIQGIDHDAPVRVALSPALLLRLAKAIGAEEGVILTFDAAQYTKEPMRVDHWSSDNTAYGVIMPLAPEVIEAKCGAQQGEKA